MIFCRTLMLSVLMVSVYCTGVSVFGANSFMANSEEVIVEAVAVEVYGICGGSGGGKTTYTKALAAELRAVFGDNVIYISHDSYYRELPSNLTVEGRAVTNFDHPDALDSSLLRDHLLDLKKWKPVVIRDYDFTTHSRVVAPEEDREAKTVQPKCIILVEGILIFAAKELEGLFDIKIFIDTPAEKRYARRKERDMAERGRSAQSVEAQIEATVKPMHDEYVEPCKHRVDHIISGEGDTAADVAAMVKIIKARLVASQA